MKAYLLILLSVVTAPGVLAQDDIRVEDVHFHRGTSSAVIRGSISGYDAVDYHLGAEAGQQMHVLLTTSNSANYFNVIPPSSANAAIFIGSTEGGEFSGLLEESGVYAVRVYLMRSAARRGETAHYSIEFSIIGDGSPPVAAGPWPSGTDASGMLPCTSQDGMFDRSEFSMSCDFRVKRNDFGATLWTRTPGDRRSESDLTQRDLRVLYFESNQPTNTMPTDWIVNFSTDDDSDVAWDKVDDNWVVRVGEGERYWIPLAVITGG